MSSNKLHCCNNNSDMMNINDKEVEVKEDTSSPTTVTHNLSCEQTVHSDTPIITNKSNKVCNHDKKDSCNNQNHHKVVNKNLDCNENKLHINCIQIRFQRESNRNNSNTITGNTKIKSKMSARIEQPNLSKMSDRNSTSTSSSRVKCDDNNDSNPHLAREALKRHHHHQNSHYRRRHESTQNRRHSYGRHHDKERGGGEKSGQTVSKSNCANKNFVIHRRRNFSSKNLTGMPTVTIPIPISSSCSVICSSQKILVVANPSVGCCCFHRTKLGRHNKSAEKTSKNFGNNSTTPRPIPQEEDKNIEITDDGSFSSSKTQPSKIVSDNRINLENEEGATKESSSHNRDTSNDLLSPTMSTPPTIKGTNESEIQSSPIQFITKRNRKYGTTRKVSSCTSSISSSSSSSVINKEVESLRHGSGSKRKKHKKESNAKKAKKSRHRHH